VSKVNKKRRPHKKKQKRGTEEAQCNAADTTAPKEAEPANTGSFETENLQGVKEISDSRCTEDHSGLLPYDETLLDVCRSRWQFADWQGLASIDPERIQHHPQRGRIALLIAASHWQLGQVQQAQRFLQVALDSGASQRQAAQVLVSGIHQSLTEAHMTLENTESAYVHCLKAMQTGGVPGDSELLVRARMERTQSYELRENNGKGKSADKR
tara:strand:- start:84 stop:719 length:636 start_codon:yes stop_codon:yes gene_type:complete